MLKKVLVFIFGLVFCLVSFEVFLHLGHFSFASHLKEKNLWGEKIILCLGNSHTYGAGAEEGFSYPDQLQKIFKKNPNNKVQVINEGVLGMNSAQLLASLEDKLKFYKPSLVILQTGGPNYWNKQLYPFEKKKMSNHFQLKTLQFILYLRMTWNQSHNVKNEELWNLFQDSQGMNQLTRTSENDKKALKLIDEFKNRLVLHPAGSVAMAKLYEEYFKSPIDALEWYFWGIENIDESKRELVYELESYQSILRLINNNEKDEKLQLYSKKRMKLFAQRYPERMIRFKELSPAELDRWVKYDLAEIHKVLNKRGVGLILQTYPPAPPKGESIDKWANPVIRGFAQEESIVLFDQEKELKEHWKKGKDKSSEYYRILFNIYNSHLNEKGYDFVAQGLFQLIPASYK